MVVQLMTPLKQVAFFILIIMKVVVITGLVYYADGDLAQGTGVQMLSGSNGAGNDEALSGEMFIV